MILILRFVLRLPLGARSCNCPVERIFLASSESCVEPTWIFLALCEHDMAAAHKALEVMDENGCHDEALP